MLGMFLNKESVWIYEYVEYRYRAVFVRHTVNQWNKVQISYKNFIPCSLGWKTRDVIKATKLTSKQQHHLAFTDTWYLLTDTSDIPEEI